MLKIDGVLSSAETVKKIEVNVDTVYKRENIKQVEDAEGNKLWQYDETQYTLAEYSTLVLPEIEAAIAEMSMLVSALY